MRLGKMTLLIDQLAALKMIADGLESITEPVKYLAVTVKSQDGKVDAAQLMRELESCAVSGVSVFLID